MRVIGLGHATEVEYLSVIPSLHFSQHKMPDCENIRFFYSNIGGIEALEAEKYIYGWQHLGQLYFDFKIEM